MSELEGVIPNDESRQSSPAPRHIIHTRGALAAGGGGPSNNHATQNNHDNCDACGYGGRLMCCDSCPKAFHFTCLVPPLDVDNPPKGNWYCRECSAEKATPAMPAPGLFQELIHKARGSNSKSFLLPDHIRCAFEDGPHGEYVDLNKFKSEQRDWHLDCLDPPLTTPVPAYKKWMCPCHVDHALPPMRRLVSENNLTSVDNTAIENIPDKKLEIDCDPEFYLNNTLHRLPKNGIRLDYFGQMLNELFGSNSNIVGQPIEASQVSRGKKRELPSDDKEEQTDPNPNKKPYPERVIGINEKIEMDENSYQQNPLLLLTEVALAENSEESEELM
ncbi:5289_t:CDS:2 [Diversispora eburnea]|uniref:5289_t:CDS:1 n=1 Tax=Diversispora eburnea TaxID=1213867 RepID=A0A9N8UZJ2_9GLOM|nr:5289_t:CDS:2 [Diversispora eburnea]